RICDDTPSSVIYLKRHPAMIKVIERYVDQTAKRLSAGMRSSVPGVDGLSVEFLQSNLPLLSRLREWQKKCLQAGALPLQVEAFFSREMSDLTNAEIIRSEIFSNSDLLGELLQYPQHSKHQDPITPGMIKTLQEH